MTVIPLMQIILGSGPWIAEDGTRPDGRWLARDNEGRVTIVKRSRGLESMAFQPIDFATAEAIAHRVIDGDRQAITDPLTLAALAAVVADMGVALTEVLKAKQIPEGPEL